MRHTHFMADVPVHIQLHGAKMNAYLDRKLSRTVTKLKELNDGIVSIDVQLDQMMIESTVLRKMAITVRIAGAELKASDSGKQWKQLFKHVQERLKRQVEKRKELLTRHLINYQSR